MPTGVHGLSLDSLVDIPKIAPRVPRDVVADGQRRPVSVMLKGTREDVRRETMALIDAMAEFDNLHPLHRLRPAGRDATGEYRRVRQHGPPVCRQAQAGGLRAGRPIRLDGMAAMAGCHAHACRGVLPLLAQ